MRESILLVTNLLFHKSNPLMCSAANMAYRKSAFRSGQWIPRESWINLLGMDEFFTSRKMQKNTQGKLWYVSSREHVVY